MDFEILKKLLTVFTAKDIIYALAKCDKKNLYTILKLDSKEVWEIFFETPFGNEKRSLAFDKNCPEEILRKLAEDESEDVRLDVAANANCPEDILRKLAEDETESVRKVARAKLKC